MSIRNNKIIKLLLSLLFICGCQTQNNTTINTNEFTGELFYHYIESNDDKKYIMINICIYNDKINDIDNVKCLYDKNINYKETFDNKYNIEYVKEYFHSKIIYETQYKPFYYLYETNLNEKSINETLPNQITIKYNNEEITITMNAFIKL